MSEAIHTQGAVSTNREDASPQTSEDDARETSIVPLLILLTVVLVALGILFDLETVAALVG